MGRGRRVLGVGGDMDHNRSRMHLILVASLTEIKLMYVIT